MVAYVWSYFYNDYLSFADKKNRKKYYYQLENLFRVDFMDYINLRLDNLDYSVKLSVTKTQ